MNHKNILEIVNNYYKYENEELSNKVKLIINTTGTPLNDN
jgi:hypothetical protein